MEKETAGTRFRKLFNLRRDESRLVGGLFLHYFFQGFGLALLIIIANTQFLSNHPIHQLPVVYMLSAVVLLLFGQLYAWLEHHLPLRRLFSLVALIILGLSVLSWAGFAFIESAYISFGLFIAYRVIYMLANLEFWGLSAILFDVRQSKRLFGLISAGDVPSKLLGYLSASLLTPVIGIQNLLLLGTVSFLLSLLFMGRVISAHDLHISEHHEHHVDTSRENVLKRFFGSNLAIMLALLSAIVVASVTAIDYAFLSGVKQRFSNDVELAQFLGLFFALGSALTIVIKLFLSGRLVNKYGVIRALMIMPALLLVVSLTIIISHSMSSTDYNIFILFGIMMMVAEVLIYALHNPTFLAMFQPLDLHRRLQGHTTIKGVADPVSLGLSGAVLYFLIPLGAVETSDLIFISYLLLVSIAGWMLTLYLVKKEYFETLKSVISNRFLGTSQVSFDDDESFALMRKKMDSPFAEDTIYALELMKHSGTEEFQTILQKQLSHSSDLVRAHVIGLIADQKIEPLLPDLLKRIDKETSPTVRAKAILAYCGLAGEAPETVFNALESQDIQLRSAAICGLIQTGGIEEIVMAGDALLKFANSDIEEEKIAAIEIIANLKISKFYKPLIRFLDDEKATVRRAALIAAGKLGNSNLLPIIFEQREGRPLSHRALDALVGFGSAAIPFLQKRLESDDSDNIKQHLKLIRTVRKIRTPEATNLLVQLCGSSLLHIKSAAIDALYMQHYHSSNPERWLASIQSDLTLAYNIKSCLRRLEEATDKLLINALEFELSHTLNRICTTLTFIYHRDAVIRAFKGLQSSIGERAANAIETLDHMLPNSLTDQLIPLIEQSHAELMNDLIDRYAMINVYHRDDVLKEILTRGHLDFNQWTLAVCLYLTRDQSTRERDTYTNSPCQMLQQAANLGGDYDLDMNTHTDSNQQADLLDIEKVIILKSTILFSETPEEILVEVAQLLKPVRFKQGETIFEKNEFGSKMYIIHEGEVRIHDGDFELSTLGRRDFFGELALLDPEPRSASASAASDCLLLELAQAPFYELMEERHEVSASILTVLTRRIRQDNSKIMELLNQKK